MFKAQVKLWVPCFTNNGEAFNKLNESPVHLVIIKDLTIEDNNIKLEHLESIKYYKNAKVILVGNMERMFSNSKCNGGGRDQKGLPFSISNWDVSSVTNMERMFERSVFDGDISNWDVSSVTSMESMFSYSKFNGDISNWDVSSVTNMSVMFCSSGFTGVGRDQKGLPFSISNWDVSSVTDMRFMFSFSEFTGDISNWGVSSVTDMSFIFYSSPIEYNPPHWYK